MSDGTKPDIHKTPHGKVWVYPQMIQGSDEWLRVRKGRATASRFSEIVLSEVPPPPKPAKVPKKPKPGWAPKEAKEKSFFSKSLWPYIDELMTETIETDLYHDQKPPSFLMERGTRLEPDAIESFKKLTGLSVAKIGFCVRADEWELLGCSPDGAVIDYVEQNLLAGAEIKCPEPKKVSQIIREGVFPDDYKQQVHGSMVVTGLPEWHFFVYCPGMKPFHRVVKRDDYTKRMEEALNEFLSVYGSARAKWMDQLRADTQPADH